MSVSLPSSSSSGQSRTNYDRISRAAQHLVPEILQDLIGLKQPQHLLYTNVLNNNYLCKKLRSNEMKLIQNAKTLGYANFDIPLIYTLTRNLNLVPPPTKGWDCQTEPEVLEITPGDDIERLRRARNAIVHRGNANVTDSEMSDFFTMFKAVAGRLEIYLGRQNGDYVTKFQQLETSCMNESVTDLSKKVESVIMKVEEIEENVNNIKKDRHMCTTSKMRLCRKRKQGFVQSSSLRKKASFASTTTGITKQPPCTSVLASYTTPAILHNNSGPDLIFPPSTTIVNDVNFSTLLHQEPGNSQLKLYYDRIVNTTELDKCVLDYLISSCVMTKDDREEVNKEPTTSGRNRIILDILIDRPYETFHHLKEALQMDPNYRWLVNTLEFTKEIPDVCNERFSHLSKAEHNISDHTLKLYKNYQKIVDQIADIENICDSLISTGDVSLEEHQEITVGKIRPDSTRCLLSKLIGRSLSAYTNFVKILSDDDINKELAATIEQTPVTEDDIQRLQIGLLKCKERKDSRQLGNKVKEINIIQESSTTISKNTEHSMSDKETNVNNKPKDTNEIDILVKACKTGSIQDVESYIKQGGNVNSTDKCGFTPIFYATLCKHIEICKLLIDAGANVNQKVKNGDTPFICACKGGRVDLAELYINHGANVDICTSNKETPLLIACLKGHEKLIDLLYTGQQNFIKSTVGWNPLTAACYKGHLSVVAALIKKGVDINEVDDEGRSPIYTACKYGTNSVVNLLLSKGCDISKTDLSGVTPLMAACEGGYKNIVESLVEKGVDINKVSVDGRSPFYMACKYGKSPVVNLLVSKGCDISKADSYGVTPFMAACEGGYKDIVENLVEISLADIKTGDESGVRPIDVACRKGHLDICKVLIVKGIDINEAGKDGWTPLMEACSQGHLSTAKYLIDNGAKLNTKNNAMENALYLSCFGSNLSLFQWLCEKGSEIDIRNNFEQSPLHIASRMGSSEICKKLILNKLDVNKKDVQGRTPLIEACCKDHVNIIKLLLKNKATVNFNLLHIACEHGSLQVLKLLITNETKNWDINKRNINSDSPLDLACRFGHDEVCKLLIEKGANKEEENPETKKTPLMEACSKGHLKIVERLLSENINKDYANSDNKTALSFAVDAGYIDIQLLLMD